jgi:hypothetical protein
MAEIHGNAGSLTFAGIATGVKSWTLSWDSEVHDITDFADGTARTFLGGLTSWTGTAECNMDATNTAKPGATGNCEFSVDGTIDYNGDVIVTNVSVSTAVDGIVSVTYAFQGNGTLTDVYA